MRRQHSTLTSSDVLLATECVYNYYNTAFKCTNTLFCLMPKQISLHVVDDERE